jgi:hypothetical protein
MITPEQLAASGTEHGHQAAFFCWAAQSGIPELEYMFAIPNGGLRNAATAGRLKAEGVKAGVPDIFLPVRMPGEAIGWACGLFIEMKVGRNKLSDEQKDYIAFLTDQGYKCEVCYSWETARDAALRYLGKELS